MPKCPRLETSRVKPGSSWTVDVDFHEYQNLTGRRSELNAGKILDPFERYVEAQGRLLHVVAQRHHVGAQSFKTVQHRRIKFLAYSGDRFVLIAPDYHALAVVPFMSMNEPLVEVATTRSSIRSSGPKRR